jgi:glutathione S-transferase
LKLYYSTLSPFARKVIVCAHEKGIAGRLELVPTSPTEDLGLRQLNPLAQVPTLLTDDGEALFDSPVICEHLELIAPEPRLIPAEGVDRVAVLQQQALADGLMDAAVARRREGLRPEGLRSTDEEARLAGKMGRALDWLESRAGELGATPDLGRIAVACALGYVDLRFGHEDFRVGRPRLAGWHAAFAARPSMVATVPG